MGKIDGICRVLFGSDLSFWLHKVLLLDSMSLLSSGRIQTPLIRYILVDVDDIFVGKKGIRMIPSDVHVSQF